MAETSDKATTIKVQGHTIRQLTEDTLNDWLVDIRAVLRPMKLWKYATEAGPEDSDLTKPWLEKAEETADIMTPTINPSVKKKLDESHFNNSYLMLEKIKKELQPAGDAQFMRLTQEYYSLDYDDFNDMSAFLTHVKILEERIDATDITLTKDKRTLICLMMALVKQATYRSLIQIWNVTPDITAEKARAMLMEEYRQQEHIEEQEGGLGTARKAGKERRNWRKQLGAKDSQESPKPECKTCGKKHNGVCWLDDPSTKPEGVKIREERARLEAEKGGTTKRVRSRAQSDASDISSSHPLFN